MPRLWHRKAAVLTIVVCLCGLPLPAWSEPERYEGRRLTDALRALQSRGLRIVFSSEVVTRDMRVAAEPRAKAPLEVLDEILKPHGLKVERGPGLVLQVVRAAPSVRPEPRKAPGNTVKDKGDGGAALEPAYTESIHVTAHRLDDPHRGVGAEVSLTRADLENASSVLADDPMRAAHSLPRVAAADDFGSEFSVRGSAYRHIGVVVDGVATPWLSHAAHGRNNAGSIAMFSSDVVEQATLQAGAYPQRDGDWLGAQLGLTVRQGSRTDTHVRASIGGTSAAVVAEGPLGRAERGSWLVAARHSYQDWPRKRRNALDETVFGFADAQAKLVYDVRPGHQVSVTALGGRSGIDGPDAHGPEELANGTNRAGLLSVRWVSTVSPRLKVSQQAHLVSHQFQNKHQTGQDGARGTDGEISYRVDLIRSVSGGLLEAGAQARRAYASRELPRYGSPTEDGRLPLQSREGFSSAAYLRSGYVNFAWMPTPRLTVTPGVRFSTSTLAGRSTWGRWVLGEWSIRDGWTVNASAGMSNQFADFEETLAGDRRGGLRPERAAHAEVGIAQRLSPALRWQASVFSRRERDVLREPEATVEGPMDAQFENAFTGSSGGVEVLVERRASTGLSGWAAYSYGRSRYTDPLRNEVFWGDFDQRHAVNVHAFFALSERAGAAITFRGGTNFPIPGYLAARDEKLFAGSHRNAVRLPPYARLDLRAERSFAVASRRVTLFVEVLNVLNRTNIGLADGIVRRGTREAVGFTEPLFPRLPSAGLRVDF